MIVQKHTRTKKKHSKRFIRSGEDNGPLRQTKEKKIGGQNNFILLVIIFQCKLKSVLKKKKHKFLCWLCINISLAVLLMPSSVYIWTPFDTDQLKSAAAFNEGDPRQI